MNQSMNSATVPPTGEALIAALADVRVERLGFVGEGHRDHAGLRLGVLGLAIAGGARMRSRK